MQSVQSCKDWGFIARTIFIAPPSIEQLEIRLRESKKYADDTVADLIRTAETEVEQYKADASFYDFVITNDDLENAYDSLEATIYRDDIGTDGVHGDSATKDGDITMNEEEAVSENPPAGETAAEEA